MKTTSSLKPLLFALVALTMLSVSIRSDWLGKYLSSVHEQNLRQDQPRVSELTSAARRLAGPNATFCNGGHFYDKRRMPSADACAVAAFKARKPFRLLYQRGNGRDGYDEAELVVTPGGAGFLLSRHFYTDTGDNPPIVTLPCKKVVVVWFDGRQRVECH